MGRYEDLLEEYTEKYGELDRSLFTEEEEIAWVEACYDHYLNDAEQKDVFGGPYSDEFEEWYGHPFEIVGPVPVDDPGYDLFALPLFFVRIPDMEGDPKDPGTFAAYPEELFVDE